MTADKTNSSKQEQALKDAPEHVKLAVDLIYLFESNNIEPELALKALDIVKQDLMRQQK